MAIRPFLVPSSLVKFLHISLSELHKSSCNKRYPIKLRLNSGVWGVQELEKMNWGVKAERCEQWRQEGEALAAVGHFEMVKASRSELRITITDGDGGDWINRGGAELTKKDGDSSLETRHNGGGGVSVVHKL